LAAEPTRTRGAPREATLDVAPFLFIVGRGRSGTTLLRAMFDAHASMAVPPESHFLVRMGKTRRRYERDGGFAAERFAHDLAGQYGFRRWEIDEPTVVGRLVEVGVTRFPDAIRQVFALYAERQGKTRYAEKTPINVMHIPTLATTFPEAHFIHLIRDGRDVALSYLDADFGTETLAESAIYWRRFVRKGRRDGTRLGDRYREIRYEDLLREPEAALRSLCEFVDLPYDPAMLDYHRRAGELLRSTPRSEHHQRLHLPPTVGLRDWRTQMDPGDVELFEAIAGEALVEVGYERATTSTPIRARAKALIAHLEVLTQRARRRAAKGVRGLRRTPRKQRPVTSQETPS
jgi:Sulfotransferase family